MLVVWRKLQPKLGAGVKITTSRNIMCFQFEFSENHAVLIGIWSELTEPGNVKRMDSKIYVQMNYTLALDSYIGV